jgi:hypothetical protein
MNAFSDIAMTAQEAISVTFSGICRYSALQTNILVYLCVVRGHVEFFCPVSCLDWTYVCVSLCLY